MFTLLIITGTLVIAQQAGSSLPHPQVPALRATVSQTSSATQAQTAAATRAVARLRTLAFRVHHMAKMEAFYREAFGFVFRDEKTGTMTSRFGVAGDLTIKLVPIRATTDFVDFPVHQPGFDVPDVNQIIAAAKKHGGVLLQAPTRDGDVTVASVRDPDGNAIEIYQRLERSSDTSLRLALRRTAPQRAFREA